MCEASGKFGQLGDVCEIDGTNQQIPIGLQRYISIEELPGNFWGKIELPEVEIEEQTGRTHFLPGDIAWAHLKPSILQGKAFIINEECWGSHHFLRLSTSDVDENMRTIIWAYLKTGPIKRHLANKCTGKSESQKDVNDRALAQLPFPVLSQDQARRIAEGIRGKIRQSQELERIEGDYRNRASYLLNKAKANISNLLDDRWFNRLGDEAREALQ
jgi:type I restriction enzyme S subunit